MGSLPCHQLEKQESWKSNNFCLGQLADFPYSPASWVMERTFLGPVFANSYDNYSLVLCTQG